MTAFCKLCSKLDIHILETLINAGIDRIEQEQGGSGIRTEHISTRAELTFQQLGK